MRKIKKTILNLERNWWKSADSQGVWIWVVSAPQDELGKRTATVEQKTEDKFAYNSVASAATIEYCLMIEQVHSQILWWNKRILNNYYEILTLFCPLEKICSFWIETHPSLAGAVVGGRGVPIPTRGQTLWYAIGIICTLFLRQYIGGTTVHFLNRHSGPKQIRLADFWGVYIEFPIKLIDAPIYWRSNSWKEHFCLSLPLVKVIAY
jgi:hypothetical protein